MKILLFAPFNGIWEFAELKARVGAALKSRGHEVIYVTCNGVLRRHCVVMASSGLSPSAGDSDRDRICSTCRLRTAAVRKAFGLQGPVLEDVVDSKVIQNIDDQIPDIADISTLESQWCGVPVGRRALFPFLTHKKRSDLDLTPQEWSEYSDQLFQSMVAASAAERLIAIYRPDAVITYSSTYSVLSVFWEVARRNNIPCYFVEAGRNLAHRSRKAVFANGSIRAFYGSLRAHWISVASRPMPPALIREVTDHLVHTFSAKSVFTYSEPSKVNQQSIRDRFGVPVGSRILLATMSSYDEVFASREAGIRPVYPAVFSTQIEWIHWLCQYVLGRHDLFLIIRVHPREFPNRRETTKRVSNHAKRLGEELAHLPSNCVINWPIDKISLYDLAKETDVVLNAWSSAGKELALLGLPVVEWIPDMLLYPPDDDLCATDPEDYGRRIELALSRGWNSQQVVKMYRWHVLEYGLSNFVTSRPGSILENRAVDLGVRAVRKVARRVSPFFADAWFANWRSIPAESVFAIEGMLASGAPSLAHGFIDQNVSAGQERAALAFGLRRLIFALFGSDSAKVALHQHLLDLSRMLQLDALKIPKS